MTRGDAELRSYLDEHDAARVSIHRRYAHFVGDAATFEESDDIAAFMSC